MPDREYYSRDEVVRILDAMPVTTDLPGGGVMIVKGGAVGVGRSRDGAAADWWQRLREMIARPKPPAGAAGDDTGLHTPLHNPTGEALAASGSSRAGSGKAPAGAGAFPLYGGERATHTGGQSNRDLPVAVPFLADFRAGLRAADVAAV
jgi:hypothetical protein